MITKEFLDKYFKFHNKLVLYTPKNVKLVFTKESHFHMEGGCHTLDLMDITDLAEFCNARGLTLESNEQVEQQ
jgi:hypothetical protein